MNNLAAPPFPNNPPALPTPNQLLEQLRTNVAQNQGLECLICLEAGDVNAQRPNGFPASNRIHLLSCCRQAVHRTCLATFLGGVSATNTQCPHCRVVICAAAPLTQRQQFEQCSETEFSHLSLADASISHDPYMYIRMATYDRVLQAFMGPTHVRDQDITQWVRDIVHGFHAQGFPADQYLGHAHRLMGGALLEAVVADCVNDMLADQGVQNYKNVQDFGRFVWHVRQSLRRDLVQTLMATLEGHGAPVQWMP